MSRLLFAAALAALCACAAPALHGTPIEPPRPAPPIRLTDQHGKPFALSNARGQAVVLYFGYTHCRDVCPQTLALLAKARAQAGFSPQDVRIIMISIDPRADTPRALRRFFRRIHITATGLTGSPAQLAPVYRDYGIARTRRGQKIVHTDLVYLIDAHGNEREVLDPQTPVRDIASDLQAIGG